MAKKVVKKKAAPPAEAKPTTVQVMGGTCVCGLATTMRLPLPPRLHVMSIEMFCHECKKTFTLKEGVS